MTIRRTRLAPWAVVLLLLSACASTNMKSHDQARGPGSLEPGSSFNPTTGETPGARASGAPRPGATGAAVPGSSTGRPGSVPRPRAGESSRPGNPRSASGWPFRGVTGRGFTATTINIGITLFKVGGAGVALGSDADTGDTEAQAKAAIGYVNAHGGIAGRQVVPIFHTFDLTRPGLQDGQSEQEACAKWTQDNKVFAVINITYSRLALLSCLAKAGVPGVHDAMPIDDHTLSKYWKYWYSDSQVSLDRLATTNTRRFCQRGWFTSGAKVGIEYFEDPEYKRIVDQRFIPELNRCGVPTNRIVLQGAPRGGQDGANYAARFKREGVTHVMFLGEASLYPLFFMRGAENQNYHPKYGLSTAQTPALLLQDLVPAAQMRNAIGMGWLPTADVDAPQDPGPVSKANTLCMKIERAAGQDMSNRQAAAQANLYCGGLWLLQQAMVKAPTLSTDGLAAALRGFGHYASSATFGDSFTRTRHDGPIMFRDFSFPNGRSTYSGPLRVMP